ncbi:MAG TPA: branched-chain-amino-acid transaminase [Candidatus Methylacidiphilales bacterium]|nr:branched-chain-amino-acid transaminase [Candidatus Methylacidiphilales bacterium]
MMGFLMHHLKIYLDGKFVNEPDAKVSVFDHGLLYGDGVFEGIRFYNGRIFLFEEHLDRLYDSAKAILLTIPMERETLREATLETCRQNDLRDGYIRLVVTRGKGDLGLNPTKCGKATVFIIAATIELYPEKLYTEGLRVNTVPTQRISPAALSPAIKSLNYLNNILAKIEGNLYGAHESILLNQHGFVAECTADNIFVIKQGKIFTPHVSDGALGGITRKLMFELAREMGREIIETNLTRYDLFVADEIFLTGTGAEVVPISEVDGRKIGPGRVGTLTQEFIRHFREKTQNTGVPIY